MGFRMFIGFLLSTALFLITAVSQNRSASSAMRSRLSSHIFDLALIREAFAFQTGYIVQQDFRSINQDQYSLDLIQLLQPSSGGEVGPAVFPLIRMEPGDRDLWLLRDVLQQNRLPPVQFRLGVLVQLHLLVGQTSRLRDSPCVADEGSEGAEDGGPLCNGHSRVSGGGGMGQVEHIVIFPAHA